MSLDDCDGLLPSFDSETLEALSPLLSMIHNSAEFRHLENLKEYNYYRKIAEYLALKSRTPISAFHLSDIDEEKFGSTLYHHKCEFWKVFEDFAENRISYYDMNMRLYELCATNNAKYFFGRLLNSTLDGAAHSH